MMPIVNSSASLPVKSKDGNDDYNIGDFLTIKDLKEETKNTSGI